MRSRFLLIVLAWPAIASGAVAQDARPSVLGPIESIRTGSGPAVVLRPWTAMPLVAVRMAVPLESPDDAEAAQVLQALVRTRIERDAALQGATVEFTVEPTRAVYTIVGPVRAFDTYVVLLRRAADAPSVSPPTLRTTRAAVRGRVLAGLDTPEPLIRDRLRRALLADPGDGDRVGSALASPQRLRAFWSRTFRPGRLRVIVVGPVPPDAVRSAFVDWPRPAEPTPATDRPPSGPAPPTPEPQALRPWVGLAFPAGPIEPATLAVAARLVERRLEQAFLDTHRAELWWTRDGGRALVLIGSASPTERRALLSAGPAGADTAADDGYLAEPAGNAVAGIASQLESALARTAALLTPEAVARARRAIRRDILFATRTPHGLAAVLDEFYGRTGDPAAADRFLEGLDRVGVATVHAALLALTATTPLRTEVLP